MTAGVLAAGLGGPLMSRSAKAASANEKIVVAHIGVGGMGMGHLNWFAGFPDVEIAAVCDVDSNRAQAALKRLRELRPNSRAVAETDFRRILERPDIDAITYATPDHWHALNAILAFQAGKHVYGEKPLCHDVAEGNAMLKACKRYNRVFQLGTQIHAGGNYHRVVELVRSGILGKIHTVRLWREGADANLPVRPDSDPPPGLDWDMWLGPARRRPFNASICPYNFRLFWDYSGGIFADFWCHVADLAFWALDLDAPLTVSAGGTDPVSGMEETPGFMDAEFEFENVKLYWHSRTPDIRGAQGRGLGAQFVGTKGELVSDYHSHVVFIGDKEYREIPEVPQSIPRSPGHQQNFVDCIKSAGEPESNMAYAVRMALPMHLALISYRLGRKLTWDNASGSFVNDEAANRMRHRPYRSPWTLPG